MSESKPIQNEKEPFELPDTWVWGKLSECCFEDKRTISPDSQEAKELNYLGMEDVESNTGKINIIEQKVGNSNTYFFDESHILYGKLRPYLNKVVDANYKGRCTTEFVPLKPYLPQMKPYLIEYLRTKRVVKLIMSQTTGSRMPRADMKFFMNISIPLPPIHEQERIVSKLKVYFQIINEIKSKINYAKELLSYRHESLLSKTFNNNLNEYDYKPLNEVVDVISGFAFKKEDFNNVGGVNVIKITNVGVKEYINQEIQFVPEEFFSKHANYLVGKDDILIALTRPYIKNGLKVCFYPFEQMALLNQRVAAIKHENKYILNYVYYFLCSKNVLDYVKSFSKASSQPNLSIKSLKSLLIPIPPYEKIEEEVIKLEKEFKKQEEILQLIEKAEQYLENLHESVLQKAFRGELVEQRPEEGTGLELLQQIIEGK